MFPVLLTKEVAHAVEAWHLWKWPGQDETAHEPGLEGRGLSWQGSWVHMWITASDVLSRLQSGPILKMALRQTRLPT